VDEVGRAALSEDDLRAEVIRPGGLWTRLTVLPVTGSTNADLAAAAATGAPEGTVVLAERQDAGRGRLGRTWTSPPGAGLILSVLLRPAEGPDPVPPTRYGWLPLLVGVALVDAVREVAGVDTALKWPNDLMVGGAKCAGILAELVPVGDGAPGVVIGVGLNVTMTADELPRPDATSLALAGAAGAGLERARLLVALLGGIERWYRRFKTDQEGLREAYLGMCDTVGRAVRVELPDGKPLTGTATDVDGDGRLVVTPPGGAPVPVAAGDVVHVRPA
jgi:BirA family biotin operon repressor/biotin-[acetyl-CoA-carboxylase] ligase